jgi:hypothetical protein
MTSLTDCPTAQGDELKDLDSSLVQQAAGVARCSRARANEQTSYMLRDGASVFVERGTPLNVNERRFRVFLQVRISSSAPTRRAKRMLRCAGRLPVRRPGPARAAVGRRSGRCYFPAVCDGERVQGTAVEAVPAGERSSSGSQTGLTACAPCASCHPCRSCVCENATASRRC